MHAPFFTGNSEPASPRINPLHGSGFMEHLPGRDCACSQHSPVTAAMVYTAGAWSHGRIKAEGKTPREIRRRLKRYLDRRLYRALNALHSDDNTITGAARQI